MVHGVVNKTREATKPLEELINVVWSITIDRK